MVDLLKELEENAKLYKEFKDIRIALNGCTEYMDVTIIINNAIDRITKKLTLLNLELKNYEEDMAKEARECLLESDLQERGHNGPSTTG